MHSVENAHPLYILVEGSSTLTLGSRHQCLFSAAIVSNSVKQLYHYPSPLDTCHQLRMLSCPTPNLEDWLPAIEF